MVIQEVSRKIAVTKEQLEKIKSKSVVAAKIEENASVSNVEVVEQIVNDSPVLETTETVLNEAPVLEVAPQVAEVQTPEVSIFDAPVSPVVNEVAPEVVVIENSPEVGADVNQNIVNIQEEAPNLFDTQVVNTNLEVSNTQDVMPEVSIENDEQKKSLNDNVDALAKLDLLTSVLVDLQEVLEQVKASINELKEVKNASVVENKDLNNNILDVNVGVQMEPTNQVVNNDFAFESTNIFDQVPSSLKL